MSEAEAEKTFHYDVESVQDLFLSAKKEYNGRVEYSSGRRQEMIDSVNQKLS